MACTFSPVRCRFAVFKLLHSRAAVFLGDHGLEGGAELVGGIGGAKSAAHHHIQYRLKRRFRIAPDIRFIALKIDVFRFEIILQSGAKACPNSTVWEAITISISAKLIPGGVAANDQHIVQRPYVVQRAFSRRAAQIIHQDDDRHVVFLPDPAETSVYKRSVSNLDAFKDNYYDGFVVTGAPVEHMPFEDVDYWDEFKTILDWASTHVFSTMYLCWGAMGALYYRYGIHKVDYPEKIFGVFPQYLQDEYCFLTNGFDEIDLQPHSRLAGVNENEVRANHDLQILTWGPQSGPGLIATRDFSEVFALGHWEYGKYTLAEEYERDMAKGMTNVPFPKNYFPHDDPKLEPLFAWRAHANLLWRNWLNWVYQTTPYDLTEVPQLRAEKKLGTDRSIRHEPGGPRQDDFKPFVHDGYGVIQG